MRRYKAAYRKLRKVFLKRKIAIMTEVVSVKFKDGGRAYYFDPKGLNFNIGEQAVVETANGISLGTVSKANHLVEDSSINGQLRACLRKADENDINRIEENKKKEERAFKICEERILKHNLEMKLVNVEYSFDNSKIIFFFTADGRIDFRELVKDLAAQFRMRIELRQIGVRDEARMLGGLGICGQPYCCKRFLDDFQPVSIKMAKEQGLSLNPTKISGSCGRLMCCLKYEQNSYDYLMTITPSIGATVKTPEGIATVIDSNLITGDLTVKAKEEDAIPYKVNRKDVKILSHRKKQSKPSSEEDK